MLWSIDWLPKHNICNEFQEPQEAEEADLKLPLKCEELWQLIEMSLLLLHLSNCTHWKLNKKKNKIIECSNLYLCENLNTLYNLKINSRIHSYKNYLSNSWLFSLFITIFIYIILFYLLNFYLLFIFYYTNQKCYFYMCLSGISHSW